MKSYHHKFVYSPFVDTVPFANDCLEIDLDKKQHLFAVIEVVYEASNSLAQFLLEKN